MAKPPAPSAVLTIRVPRAIDRQLAREARRRRMTRSEIAREILVASFASPSAEDPAAEAKRQSLLASTQAAEAEALRFIMDAADLRGWK
jgi:hypothetical protein